MILSIGKISTILFIEKLLTIEIHLKPIFNGKNLILVIYINKYTFYYTFLTQNKIYNLIVKLLN